MDEFVDAAELVKSVQEFLQQLTPGLEAKARYDAQVAVYLLEMVRRELTSQPTVERSAASARAIRTLCADIRTGARDADWSQVLDEVLLDTVRRVEIVRPDYLATEHRRT